MENEVNAEVISAGGLLYRTLPQTGLEVYLARHGEYGFVIPKGRVNQGEDLLQAARREVYEETGYDVTFTKELFLGTILYQIAKRLKSVTFYGFELASNILPTRLNLDEGERILQGEWMQIDLAIDNVAHSSESGVIRSLMVQIRG